MCYSRIVFNQKDGQGCICEHIKYLLRFLSLLVYTWQISKTCNSLNPSHHCCHYPDNRVNWTGYFHSFLQHQSSPSQYFFSLKNIHSFLINSIFLIPHLFHYENLAFFYRHGAALDLSIFCSFLFVYFHLFVCQYLERMWLPNNILPMKIAKKKTYPR